MVEDSIVFELVRSSEILDFFLGSFMEDDNEQHP